MMAGPQWRPRAPPFGGQSSRHRRAHGLGQRAAPRLPPPPARQRLRRAGSWLPPRRVWPPRRPPPKASAAARATRATPRRAVPLPFIPPPAIPPAAALQRARRQRPRPEAHAPRYAAAAGGFRRRRRRCRRRRRRGTPKGARRREPRGRPGLRSAIAFRFAAAVVALRPGRALATCDAATDFFSAPPAPWVLALQRRQEGVARGAGPSPPRSRGVGVVRNGRGWELRRTPSSSPSRRMLLRSGAVGALRSGLGSGGSSSGWGGPDGNGRSLISVAPCGCGAWFGCWVPREWRFCRFRVFCYFYKQQVQSLIRNSYI